MDLEDEEEEEEAIENIEFFLTSSNLETYNLFQTLRMFLLEDYALDSAVMIELVNEKGLPKQETFTKIAHIHHGYSKTLLRK